MPFKNGFRLSGDDSLAFNYNFTPAASISVVDIANRPDENWLCARRR